MLFLRITAPLPPLALQGGRRPLPRPLVYTNTVPYESHHGGGIAQMHFGWGQHLNHVAGELGMDPVEFHLRNAIEKGHTTLDGSDFACCGLKECITEGSEHSGWKRKYGKLPPYKGIGIGIGAMASGGKNASKHDTSAALIKVADDGIVTLLTGIPDMGQGSHTTMAMIAAEVLGVEPADITIIAGDSDITPFDWGAFSQRGTFTTGNAVKAAAEDARAQLVKVAAAPLRRASRGQVVLRAPAGSIRGRGPNAPCLSGSWSTTPCTAGRAASVMGRGFFNSPRPSGSMAYSFGAQVAEVKVDPDSGVVRVDRSPPPTTSAAPSIPASVEGQIDGQVFSGMSQVLYEEC